jgi:hypothetical protein
MFGAILIPLLQLPLLISLLQLPILIPLLQLPLLIPLLQLSLTLCSKLVYRKHSIFIACASHLGLAKTVRKYGTFNCAEYPVPNSEIPDCIRVRIYAVLNRIGP